MRRISLSILMLALASTAMPAYGQAVVRSDGTRIDLSDSNSTTADTDAGSDPTTADADVSDNGTVGEMNDDAADNGSNAGMSGGMSDDMENDLQGADADGPTFDSGNYDASRFNNSGGTQADSNNRISPQDFDASRMNNSRSDNTSGSTASPQDFDASGFNNGGDSSATIDSRGAGSSGVSSGNPPAGGSSSSE